MRVESDTIRPPDRRNLSPGTPTRMRRRQADDPAPGIEALGLAQRGGSRPFARLAQQPRNWTPERPGPLTA